MANEITFEYLKRKKCILCGDSHKSFATVDVGQVHIATVIVCCNCGYTMTLAHSAQEYANYLMSGTYEMPQNNGICNEPHCINKEGCPRIEKGRKI